MANQWNANQKYGSGPHANKTSSLSSNCLKKETNKKQRKQNSHFCQFDSNQISLETTNQKRKIIKMLLK